MHLIHRKFKPTRDHGNRLPVGEERILQPSLWFVQQLPQLEREHFQPDVRWHVHTPRSRGQEIKPHVTWQLREVAALRGVKGYGFMSETKAAGRSH